MRSAVDLYGDKELVQLALRGHGNQHSLRLSPEFTVNADTAWDLLRWDLPLDNAEAFSATLDRLAAMSIDEHLQMRKTVLAWAKNKFSQRDAIEANIAMFRYAYEN